MGKYYKELPIYAAKGLHEASIKIILSVLKPPAKVLDIAAGSGAFAMRLKDAGFEVEANDINDKAYKAYDIPKLSVDLNMQLPSFLKDSYDLVVAMEVIEHLGNPFKLIRDLKTIAKPGGYILLTVPNPIDAYSRIAFLRKGILYHFSPRSWEETGHISIILPWQLEIMIKSVALRIISKQYVVKKKIKIKNFKDLVTFVLSKILLLLMEPKESLDYNNIVYLIKK